MPTATGHTKAIRASRVIGTSVKDKDGNAIGRVEDIVLDKLENKILFAVVGFGGLMGMGEKFHPMPWSVLDYDETVDAYTVPYTKAQLEAAPNDSITELTRDDGSAYWQRTNDFYGVQPSRH
jgi:sporulation protein YlmC with PRC-barrel domain